MIFYLITFIILYVDYPRVCLHSLVPSLSPNLFPSLSPIPPPPRKWPSPMCGHLKPKRRQIETVIGQITNPRIQPLLSMKVERPENLTFDKIKYEFSKLFCPPTKTDLGSDEELATEPDITLQKKCLLKVSFEYFDYINVFLINLLFYSIAETLDDLQTNTSETIPTLYRQ